MYNCLRLVLKIVMLWLRIRQLTPSGSPWSRPAHGSDISCRHDPLDGSDDRCRIGHFMLDLSRLQFCLLCMQASWRTSSCSAISGTALFATSILSSIDNFLRGFIGQVSSGSPMEHSTSRLSSLAFVFSGHMVIYCLSVACLICKHAMSVRRGVIWLRHSLIFLPSCHPDP